MRPVETCLRSFHACPRARVQAAATGRESSALDVTLGNPAAATWTKNVALTILLPNGTARCLPPPQASVPYLQMVP